MSNEKQPSAGLRNDIKRLLEQSEKLRKESKKVAERGEKITEQLKTVEKALSPKAKKRTGPIK
jgi:predicted  nucleic acid-binding Zn-ribbon protein